MKATRYFLSCYPAALVVAGNLLGGYWTIMNLVNTTIIMTLFEYFFGSEKRDDNDIDGDLPNIVLYVQAMLHSIAIGSLLYGVSTSIITGWWIVAAAASTGFFAGQNGIVNAHELIHRKSTVQRLIGIWSLIIVNYGHFYVEHVRGHHKYVGTPRDPATARFGESIYAFIARTIPQQFLSACQLESERLNKSNQSFFHNIIVRVVFVQIMLCVSIGLLLGVNALLAYIGCSLLAVSMLEYVNYIEHYGLVRDNGERVSAKHSWQSDVTFSRFTLIELSRHADHHYVASKPYHTLVSHNDSPVLPGGYYACFIRVLIPSLWFRSVHPIIEQRRNC